ncbi:phosphatase PAP2 family protein [Microbacterium sp. CFH 31415]|uniref:phosphatase PAP2 family protein n=1 Tax=Microbacterium sp. CFH 31415 TaxID=2921732 RepID=UPI001F134EC1|nr:phosphatase PAP2 family protein [Microbacterium sp. CFH 31415]MCH6230738.1 phosphatase PAP2 family protein [Microbacterium sp. CFH 31415]
MSEPTREEPMREDRGHRTRNLWLVSLAYGGAFLLLYFTAVLTAFGQLVDAGSLSLFGWMRSEAWLAFYDGRDIVMYCVVGAAVVAALSDVLEHRWKAPLYSAALVGVVAVISLLMKEFAPRPDLGDWAYAHNTFPSGHTAITLAAAVAIIWCYPRWMSPVLVLVLGGVVAFVALGSLFSMAHRASDSIGGALLAGAVSCALAALSRATQPVSSRLRRGSVIAGGVMVGVGLLYLAGALGFFGGGDHALTLTMAILLCTLGVIVSVLAIHRPFLVQARTRARPGGDRAPRTPVT